jgi:hypothetical protein
MDSGFVALANPSDQHYAAASARLTEIVARRPSVVVPMPVVFESYRRILHVMGRAACGRDERAAERPQSDHAVTPSRLPVPAKGSGRTRRRKDVVPIGADELVSRA